MNSNDNIKNMFRADLTERESAPGPSLSGAALLLCVMAALCVTVLGVLCSSRAEASRRLSQDTAGAVMGYYNACLDANRDIAGLRASGEITEFICEYDAGGTQSLHVVANIGQNGDFEILKWQTVPDLSNWAPDEHMKVAE